MKLKISIGANIALLGVVLFLSYLQVSHAVGDFYYRKTVGIVASGAVAELEKGNTNLVHEALVGIESDPDSLALYRAGSKLGVITLPK